jgi:uncharacterized membrane protein
MLMLLIGLVLFLGMHSVRVFADGWRTDFIASRGEIPWKILYAVVSLAGLVLLIIGWGQTRANPVWLWYPETWMAHLVALLMIPAFILLVAAYVPANHIKAKLAHPMVLSVKVWAFAHLIANGRLGDLILFGAFLAWAVVLFAVSRRRPRVAGPAPTLLASAVTVVGGVIAYLVFAFYLHMALIGVPVMRVGG